MKDGVCPKCGSHKVYSGAHVSKVLGGHYNTIPVSGNMLLPRRVVLDNYVCVNCGYVESYISDKRALRDIERKWKRVDEMNEGAYLTIRPVSGVRTSRATPLQPGIFERTSD